MHIKLIKRIACRVSTTILNDALACRLLFKKIEYDNHANLKGDHQKFFEHTGI